MPELSFPTVDGSGSSAPLDIAHWRRANFDDTGILGSPGDASRQVYADSSGMQVKRRPGERHTQGIAGTDTAEKVITGVAPNASGQPRIDRVVDRMVATGVITTIIVQGTPSATPSKPALTQVEGGIWDEPLAWFRVEAGAGTAGNAVQSIAPDKVVDERLFLGLRTIVVDKYVDLARIPNPRLRQSAIVDDDGLTYTFNGSIWVATQSLRTNIAANMAYGGNSNNHYAQQSGWWQVVGGICFWHLLTRMSGANPNGQVSMNLPWQPAGGTPAPVPATSTIGGAPAVVGYGIFASGGTNIITTSINTAGTLLDGRGVGSAALIVSGQDGDVADLQGHYAI